MATFDFVIDRSTVGQSIGPANGFLVDLRQTKSPVDDGPSRCAPDGTWVSGKIQLRGSQDVRDVICSDSLDVGGWSGQDQDLGRQSFAQLSRRPDGPLRAARARFLKLRCPMSS